MPDNKLVRDLVNLGVVKKGTWTLANGEETDTYYDFRICFGYPEILDKLAELLWHNTYSYFNATCVAANGYGGVPLAVALSLQQHLRLTLVRDAAKDHGTQNILEGYIPNAADKVLIVDDVLTTGANITKVKAALPADVPSYKTVLLDRGIEGTPYAAKVFNTVTKPPYIAYY